MNVHVLQHVPFEDIGSMATWFEKHNAALSYTRFYENYSLPNANDIDLVVVMGGPMSVNDESEFSWLRQEKQFIKEAILKKVAVLGVCLGAQLIANSMGARVYKNQHAEIGWFPIEGMNAKKDCFTFPASSQVFHWHGETFDLPSNAIHLAKSKACEHQAFQIGEKVIGLQFHLEVTPQSMGALIKNCSDELIQAPFIQRAEEMQSVSIQIFDGINKMMDGVLNYITGVKD